MFMINNDIIFNDGYFQRHKKNFLKNIRKPINKRFVISMFECYLIQK